MRNRVGSFRFLFVFVLVLALTGFPTSASASHSNGLHWARSSNPVTVRVIDSMSSSWDDNLDVALSDWNASSVLTLVKEAGDSSSTTRRRCSPVTGKVRACNYTYGRTGWAGVAYMWYDRSNHIVQATAQMNDTYMSSYPEVSKQQVICQEIGHDWGLDHQDESGADLNTCMDYADAFDNPHPNAHDYQQLETIYNSHLDGGALSPDEEILNSEALSKAPAGFMNAELRSVESWGTLVRDNGRTAVYVRDFGKGYQIITFVFWAK